ncbi:endospore germination permease [Haloimpatiens sp. FM7330]|uniref:GerAB/ArcD/ProY family transporter n=1 Tax=Haloimpatiens sp. FM7330 TaxID=3298610 RepID=UPI00363027BD
MNKEIISDNHAMYMIIIFCMGVSLIFSMAAGAKQDGWIAIILATTVSIPLAFMYCKILNIFPNKNIFDIFEIIFGKFIGKIFSVLYIGLGIYIATLIISDFTDFIKIVGAFGTPKIIPLILVGFLCIWMLKGGIEVMARWTKVVLFSIVFLAIITWIMLIPQMNINNLKPVLYNGFSPIIKETMALISFPFGELFLFTGFINCVKKTKNLYNIFLKGIVIAGSITLVANIVNIMVLGTNINSKSYFPAYETVRRLEVAGVFGRIEIIVASTFVVTEFIEACFCMLTSCKGIQKLFNCKDYRFIVTPTVLLVINLSLILYNNLMEAMEFDIKIWPYVGVFFEVVLPFIILIFALIKKKKDVVKQ